MSSTPEAAVVRTEISGHVTFITINRAERRNALNDLVVAGLISAFEDAAADSNCRAIVLSGEGDKAFCAGGDLKAGTNGGPFAGDISQPAHFMLRLFRLISESHKPVIARVNGDAMGGGSGLVCACDIAVMADTARIGTPEVKVGLFPMMIVPPMIRVIPRRRLLEMYLTGEPWTADQALEFGIVNYVTPPDELDAKIAELTDKIVARSPTAVRLGKYSYTAMQDMTLDQQFRFAETMLPRIAMTEDAREGFAAFREKRSANWTGRQEVAMTERTVRIGCASGFWGDSPEAVGQLVTKGDINYLVFDYLAEITMSLLARARTKSPEAGYAPDFVQALAPFLPELKRRGIKVVANAGGVNPRGCRNALAKAAEAAGLKISIGAVLGDDLMDQAERMPAAGITEMFSGLPFPDRLMSINAYLGARPIAAALASGADIVVTGRCADSAVALGPLMHEFGWGDEDWDRLSQGSLAGHLIECGPQGTGGNFTDWQEVPGWDEMGMPIVEVSADGSFIMTKTPETGGLVVPASVAEQMLYEIGDPQRYILPDVICDWSQVTLERVGPDRVMVNGARGLGRTDSYKVSATHADGWRAITTLTLAAIDAPAKAERVAEAILTRCRRIFRERNLGDFRQVSVEVLGAEAAYGANARACTREVVLKIGVVHDDRDALNIFAGEVAPMAVSSAQGLTGFFAGRPKVQPVVRLFSFLHPKADSPVMVEVDGNPVTVQVATEAGTLPAPKPHRGEAENPGSDAVTVPLVALAWARSGDKGNIANIGVIARKPDYLPWIRAALTEERVKDYFSHVCEGPVERFELPGIDALNFMLHDSLGGGGIASVRIDPQAKGYGQILLDIEVSVPAELAARHNLSALHAA